VAAATRTRAARPKVDALCAAAVELARAVAEELAGSADAVGEHRGVEADEERVVTHVFQCRDPAYRGWRWSVTLARAPRSRHVTVDEAVLLPGEESVLPPAWLPWEQRLRPGDLGVGDLLYTRPDDVRLVPGYVALGDDDDFLGPQLAWELGLGRARVLSREGRADAAERWHAGLAGPDAPIAAAAPARCSTCGFWLPLAGSLRQAFGVCANAFAPDDGRVVAVDHGCGAHSEVAPAAPVAFGRPVVDEVGYDTFAVSGAAPDGLGSVGIEEPAEDLGHS
jgi:hypothetical protein